MLILGLIGIVSIVALLNKNEIISEVQVKLSSWNTYDSLYKAAANRYDVPFEYIKAIALNESNNGLAPSVVRGLANPKDAESSKSSDGKSWGIMQVTLTTAKDMDPTATVEKLNNPSYSIDLGARYLSQMLRRYRGELRQLEYAVKAYNQGPGNTDKEVKGTGGGFANGYYTKFASNLARVRSNP